MYMFYFSDIVFICGIKPKVTCCKEHFVLFMVMSVNLCCLNVDRVSHKKTIETLETEVKKLQSLLSSEKQLRFVRVNLYACHMYIYCFLFKLPFGFCIYHHRHHGVLNCKICWLSRMSSKQYSYRYSLV